MKSTRYQPSTSSKVKGNKFSDSKSKRMMTFVVKRKLISKRLINLKDHEKVGIMQLHKDRELLDSVSLAKHYSRSLVKEFYAYLNKGLMILKVLCIILCL